MCLVVELEGWVFSINGWVFWCVDGSSFGVVVILCDIFVWKCVEWEKEFLFFELMCFNVELV